MSNNQTSNGKGASCHGNHKNRGAVARAWKRRMKRQRTGYSHTLGIYEKVRDEKTGKLINGKRLGSRDYDGRGNVLVERYYQH